MFLINPLEKSPFTNKVMPIPVMTSKKPLPKVLGRIWRAISWSAWEVRIMFNMLRMDLRRLFKSRSFSIILGVTAVLLMMVPRR